MKTAEQLRAMTHEQLVKYAVRLQEQVEHKEAVIKQRAEEAKEHVDEIERRYADKEATRLGHIVRHALTPEQYYAAERAAAAEHPEAWAGVYFKAEEGKL